MNDPREILSRIQRRKRPGATPPGANPARTPAPAPIQPPQTATVPQTTPALQAAPAPQTTPVPQTAPVSQAAPVPQAAPAPRPGGHALYSELMRSHDRMGTRHVKKS